MVYGQPCAVWPISRRFYALVGGEHWYGQLDVSQHVSDGQICFVDSGAGFAERSEVLLEPQAKEQQQQPKMGIIPAPENLTYWPPPLVVVLFGQTLFNLLCAILP